jgi:hypothetical protein
MTKSKYKSDPDMFGSVEDAGWDPDASTPSVNQRTGINRQQRFLGLIPDDPASGPRKPNAQRPNLKDDGTAMGDSYN